MLTADDLMEKSGVISSLPRCSRFSWILHRSSSFSSGVRVRLARAALRAASISSDRPSDRLGRNTKNVHPAKLSFCLLSGLLPVTPHIYCYIR